MRVSFGSLIVALLNNCSGCPGGGGGDDTGTPFAEEDCDNIDDDGNGIVDDGAAEGWQTDPSRWEVVATLSAGTYGTGPIDLVPPVDGDGGVYLAVQEHDAEMFASAIVIYRYLPDGSTTEEGRYVTSDPGKSLYTTHAAGDASGRIWVASQGHDTAAGVTDPDVARFDPADGSFVNVVNDDPDNTVAVMGSLVPDGDGAWLSYESYAEATDAGGAWVNAYIDADGVLTRVDSWELVDRPESFDGPWQSHLDPDGVLWGAGQAEDSDDLTHAILRRGTGSSAETVVDTHAFSGTDWYEGYTGLAFDDGDNWVATSNWIDVSANLWGGWQLISGTRSDPASFTVIDTASEEPTNLAPWTVTIHPSGTIFAGGWIDAEDWADERGVVRAGNATDGFTTVYKPEVGLGYVWDIVVDEEGVVWALGGYTDGGFTTTQLLRLSCR